MKTEKKIIRHFIEQKDPKTIREISKSIGSDYKITHTACQRLIEKRIISEKKVGKSTLCELDHDYYGKDIYEVEDDRRSDLLKNGDILQLYSEIIDNSGTCLFVFLVFGSYAKSKQTKNSDIDIMIIGNDKNLEEKILKILDLLPLKTHAIVLNEKEFIRMKDSKKRNVVKEAIEHNILLYGIENYYRLKNA